MTPDEHYYQAEKLLTQAEGERNGAIEDRLVARAQVHAILSARTTPPAPPRPATGVSSLADHLRRTPR